jgi:hypothetical protein
MLSFNPGQQALICTKELLKNVEMICKKIAEGINHE